MISKRKILQLCSLIALTTWSLSGHAQTETTPKWAKETVEEKAKRLEWWTHDRFGMFIHWGLYAVAGRHEWVQSRERISKQDYQKYFDNFDPDMYDPVQWAQQAKAAGMKYVVITTKHHEGFCLWDTQYSDYKVTNTAYGKDLLKPFVDAFRAAGIRIGFYYSLIDWHHPDYIYDHTHPPTPVKPEERDQANAGRDMKKYQQYMQNQITELLTNYGQIDELFFDFSYQGKGHDDWDAESLLKLVRKLQPQIIVNDRLDLDHTSWGWDYKTPEQVMPKEWVKVDGRKVPWETCQTFSGSWGYYRDEYSWKSTRQLVAMLIEVVSKGGNLLLNVGPTSRGNFDTRATERLVGMGEWMRYNSRSIYGCTEAPATLARPDNCMLTYNEKTNRLYIHVLQWPVRSLHLQGYKDKIKYAQLLNDGSEIKYRTTSTGGSHTAETTAEGDVVLELPVQHPHTEIPVIEIMLK
ncbi:alpha-L-fucosidase [Sphingobacterium griseoflavum]|uniref:alpha-L-fucosidase n=1 Tax=Sphingobacterium griseoflavum TaxID=1474952 RepID=A0ABQ3HRK8_9SPHI|nr:alpha-L-fucosidase [Sphingobacterium griseoflavum]GHE23116.1 alpha-L-fucosidase [Sphingobacterium griseoflavum]